MALRLFFTLVLGFTASCAFCQQKQFAYYFDRDFNPATPVAAVFNGRGIYDASGLFEFRLYNAATKNLISIEHYKDSSLQLNEGPMESFYPNNTTEIKGNFAAGKHEGLWLRWDSTGRIIDSTTYANDVKISETSLGYYKNGTIDSLVNIDFPENTYQKKYYDDSARLTSEVSFKGEKGFLKYYDKGVLTMSDSVFSRLEIEASFPGGPQAWTKYIVTKLQNNGDKIIKSGEFGTCIVKFIVNKEGKVTDAQATTMQGTVLAQIAVRIILNSPKWNPASQYGRMVNAYRLQPVTLNRPD